MRNLTLSSREAVNVKIKKSNRTCFLRSSQLTSGRHIDWSLLPIVSLINASAQTCVVAQQEFHALHTFLHVNFLASCNDVQEFVASLGLGKIYCLRLGPKQNQMRSEIYIKTRIVIRAHSSVCEGLLPEDDIKSLGLI